MNDAIASYNLTNHDICLTKMAMDTLNAVQSGGGRQGGGCNTCKEGVAKLKAMTVDSLRNVAKQMGVKGRWGMNKAQLIAAIRKAARRVNVLGKKNA